MTPPWIIVGLGNPGPAYAHTRHNVGYDVVECLASRRGATLRRHKTRALVAEDRLDTSPGGAPGPRVVLAETGTFMNVSGGPVAALCQYYGTPPEQLLVVHDDLDLAPETLRLKRGGGEGGHNGLKSISQALSTRDYLRLRVGIGRPPGRQDPADYVLRPFPLAERPAVAVTVEEAADAIEDVVTLGLLTTQQRLHTSG